MTGKLKIDPFILLSDNTYRIRRNLMFTSVLAILIWWVYDFKFTGKIPVIGIPLPSEKGYVLPLLLVAMIIYFMFELWNAFKKDRILRINKEIYHKGDDPVFFGTNHSVEKIKNKIDKNTLSEYILSNNPNTFKRDFCDVSIKKVEEIIDTEVNELIQKYQKKIKEEFDEILQICASPIDKITDIKKYSGIREIKSAIQKGEDPSGSVVCVAGDVVGIINVIIEHELKEDVNQIRLNNVLPELNAGLQHLATWSEEIYKIKSWWRHALYEIWIPFALGFFALIVCIYGLWNLSEFITLYCT